MTTTDDLDRVLAQWLEEGQAGAPDWPIERAIDHARSHPRRRDPFAFLRSDVMPAGRSRITLQPVGILAVLGLVVALVAAVAVGGGLRREAVVPPPSDVSESPSPSPTAPPTGEAVNPPDRPFTVLLRTAGGDTKAIEISDSSGLVQGAESGSPGEGVSFGAGEVEVTNLDPTTLSIGWSGGCEDRYFLDIGATGPELRLEAPICAGDAVATDLILVLRFSEPVAADDVVANLFVGAGLRVPKFRQFTSDGTDGIVWVSVADSAETLAVVDQAPSEANPVERDVLLVEAADGDPSTLIVTWSGPTCETEYELVVETPAGVMELRRHRQPCSTESLTNRSIALTFTGPVDPASMTTTIMDLGPE